ncbi:LacI family transcriptional regulator [Roseomonas sp. KE2513]|uniref:LacI family DNA-binding transcriptional regulator n=1 Tax=Roseomonas sp. KE2513 TaxID=2479202 RepID=UPI0018DFA21F|nr:LacI family DNA-binding transcriptional regulator [Roseomonas sp. KE2513]MBI0535857.1 LacI family transcriptional regulator [Roseomonas sp. KE2513]
MSAPTKITVREVASAAGVSIATVSRVLNQPALVQQSKREAVERAMVALDYIPNRQARSLMSQRTGSIGLLVPTIANPLFAPVIAAIERVLDAAGYALLIHCTQRDPARQQKQVRHLVERGVDGLILTGTSIAPDLAALLDRTSTPAVVQDALLLPPGAPAVAFDNAAAMAVAVRHVHGQGHRAIALFSGPLHNTPAVAERFAGAERELRALGLHLPAAWRVLAEDYDNTAVRDGAARLLSCAERPTAVACTGDILALGLVAEGHRRGLRVPQDFSVIGCGDTDLGRYVEPPLTTVRMPWERMGEAAVEGLLALIEGRPTAPLTVLPHELIERHSVQPPTPFARVP